MTSGTSTWHIMENFIRIELDTYGYPEVRMLADEKYSWVLYRDGNIVGKAYYNLDHVIIEVK